MYVIKGDLSSFCYLTLFDAQTLVKDNEVPRLSLKVYDITKSNNTVKSYTQSMPFCIIIFFKTACGYNATSVCHQRQEMTASTETLDTIGDATPQALPYHSNTSTLRSSDSPKRDATEMYLKSKALLESRRECEQILADFNCLSCNTWNCDPSLKLSSREIILIHRASHQRHRCFSEERH